MARFTEQSFFVMAALAQQALHGYGILQDVRDLSQGSMRFGTGTLYGVLDRLIAAELVEHDSDEMVGGRLRRYYRLTAGGVAELGRRAEERRSSAEVTLSRLRVGRTRDIGIEPA